MRIIISGLCTVFLLLGTSAQAQLDQRTCLIEPSKSVEISSAVEGVVTEVNVERGDRVKDGDILFQIDSSVERSLVSHAQARSAFAKRELDRNAELIERGLLSEKEVDELRTNYRVAEAELQTRQFELNRRSARSPINGIVFEKLVSVGEYVNQQPVLQLVSIDPLYAEVVMGVSAFGKVDTNMLATVALGAPISAEQVGVVSLVDQIIDPTSSTFRVRIEIPNEELSMPSGVSCEVIEFKEKPAP